MSARMSSIFVPPSTVPALPANGRDCPTCPVLVEIPGGDYVMGSPETEPGRESDEGPQRTVSVPRFALARTETTVDNWQACVDDGGCQTTPNPEFNAASTGNHPVVGVSWDDAQEFVAWLNTKVPGDIYRLPSEAEWEFAARAGSQTAYPWGEEWDPDRANGVSGIGEGYVEVGSFPSNDFGVHDMIGNVWEWTEDCWHDSYEGAPAGGGAWMAENGGDCSLAVLRGGAWYVGTSGPAFRGPRLVPARRAASAMWGFRVARTLPD